MPVGASSWPIRVPGCCSGSTAELLAGERVSRYVPGVLGEQILRQLRETSQLELQGQRDDGRPIPLAVSLTSFSHDETCTTYSTCSTCRRASGMKNVFATLSRHRQRVRAG